MFASSHTFNQSIFEEKHSSLPPSKLIGITISMINIVPMSLFLYSIIWYERFGTNHNRTLINQFVTSTCWAGLVYNIFVLIPEVIIAFGFPAGHLFCSLSIIIRNVLVIFFGSLSGAISIVKYLYIFCYKNPSGKNDEFWCCFVNLTLILMASISQFVFQFLPGKNPYYYYICCGRNPKLGHLTKVNHIAQLILICSFIVYVFVVFRIKCHEAKYWKAKVVPIMLGSSKKNNTSTSTVGQNLKNALSNLITIAVGFITLLPIIYVAAVLNTAPPEILGTYPYYELVQFHLHGCPFMLCLIFVVTHFVNNKKLREVMFRETEQNFLLYL